MKSKRLIGSILPLIITVILFIWLGSFGFSKISDIFNAQKSAEKDLTTLTQKLTLLKIISQSVASEKNLATSALPEANPVLEVLSQLQNFSFQNEIALSEIKSGTVSVDTSGVNEIPITFTAEGDIHKMISFLATIDGFSPVVVLDSVDVGQSTATDSAKVTVRAFWAPLPKTIPSVTQAITDLTPSEKETLTEVSNLAQPALFSSTPSDASQSAGGVNPNPFGI